MHRRIQRRSSALFLASLAGLPSLASAAGVPVGSSSLISAYDYADTFTVGNAPRFDALYNDNSGGAYNVEQVFASPGVTWAPTDHFSFNSEASVCCGYPFTPGNSGSATGMAQTGGGDFSHPYGLRNFYVVQVDAIPNFADRVDIGTFANAGDSIFTPGAINVFFRHSGTIYPEIGIYNSSLETGLPHGTGLDASDTSWHNFAVAFDISNKLLYTFVDETMTNFIDLNTFAGGVYSNISNGAIGVGSAGSVDWFDNWQVGEPASITPPANQWGVNRSGDWNASANWTSSIPNGVDAVANFLGVSTSNHTVYTDLPITVGAINFDNPASYVIAGSADLTMATSGGPATITVASGAHTINLPVNVPAGQLDITTAEGSALNIADPLNLGAGVTVNKNGPGFLAITAPLFADTPGATLKLNGGVTNLDFGAASNIAILVDPSTLNLGASQSLANLQIIGGSTVNVGIDRFGRHTSSKLTAGTVAITGGGNNILKLISAANEAAVTGSFSISDGTTLTLLGQGKTTISGIQSYGAGATLTSAEGTLVLATNASGNLDLGVTGGLIRLESTQHLNSLSIAAGGRVEVKPGGDKVIVTNALTIEGAPGAWLGRIDLADNDMIVQATAGDAQSVVATLTSQIASGRNANASLWTGPGISSSIAAGNALTALGVLLNDDGAGQPIHTSFDEQAVNTTSILVKYTWNGDADLSGGVDADDYFRIDSGFALTLTGWFNGDFDYSEAVDADDYFLIDSAFAAQTGPLGAAAVPEPATLAVFGCALGSLLIRRRRINQPPPA